MLTTRFIIGIFLNLLMVLGTASVSGQTYPNRPIRIVTSEQGGTTDFASRLIAQRISPPLGQPVIVDNRPSGVIPGEIVSKALPDGYTVLIYGPPLWIGPLLQQTRYDVLRDFSPVTLATRSPNCLVVHPSVPAKSVKELIALAKARPGELNYSSAATAGSNHIAAELFKAMAGVNIVRINYKGTAPALNALIRGEVHLSFPSVSAAISHVNSGKLRALAVTSAQPSSLLPGFPTVAESGLPGFESAIIIGIFVPTKTPAAIINRLNEEIVRVLYGAAVKEQFLNVGSETVGSSPEELVAYIKSDVARTGKVIKDAGIKAE